MSALFDRRLWKQAGWLPPPHRHPRVPEALLLAQVKPGAEPFAAHRSAEGAEPGRRGGAWMMGGAWAMGRSLSEARGSKGVQMQCSGSAAAAPGRADVVAWPGPE